MKLTPGARPITFSCHAFLLLSGVKHQTFQDESCHLADRVLQGSISPTFYHRVFCMKFWHQKISNPKQSFVNFGAKILYKKCMRKTLMKLTHAWVNFTNIILAAFVLQDANISKRQSSHPSVSSCAFGIFAIKSCSKTVGESLGSISPTHKHKVQMLFPQSDQQNCT